MSKELILEEGKYTYIQHESGGAEALRYGEHWRDLTGDKFIGAMADHIEELERERDAFYMDYRMKCDEEAKDSALVIIERDQLRAQINVLREAATPFTSPDVVDETSGTIPLMDALEKALSSTPEQSLAEHRNKVIEAFVNEFSRHVGGDGEFWLHELQDFAMKEQV